MSAAQSRQDPAYQGLRARWTRDRDQTVDTDGKEHSSYSGFTWRGFRHTWATWHVHARRSTCRRSWALGQLPHGADRCPSIAEAPRLIRGERPESSVKQPALLPGLSAANGGAWRTAASVYRPRVTGMTTPGSGGTGDCVKNRVHAALLVAFLGHSHVNLPVNTLATDRVDWWAVRVSNPRPQQCECCALPLS